MNTLICAMNGGVRTGLEENIYHDIARSRLATNLELVQRVHALNELNVHEVMTPSAMRACLGLEPGFSRYCRAYAEAG